MTKTQPVFTRKIGPEDRTKLVDWAYEEIKSVIVESKLEAGDMLRESSIADQLGISKTPVREAFLKLKEEGLIELLPYRGAMVTGYDIDDVREIFEIRVMLESECVRWAAIEGDESVIGQLVSNVDATEAAMEANDVARVVALFDEFDSILFTRLDNKRLLGLVDNLQVHLRRIGELTTEIPGRLRRSLDQHHQIVKAVANRDPDAAQREMRNHITSVLVDGLAQLQEREMANTTAAPQRATDNQ